MQRSFKRQFISCRFNACDQVSKTSDVGAAPAPGAKVPLRLAQRPEELRASVEDNLASLGLESLPLVNLRRADTGPGLRAEGDQIVEIEDQMAELIALRTAGKIRFHRSECS